MSAEHTARRRKAAVGFILVSVWLDVLSLGVIIPVYAPLIQHMQGGDASSAARWNGVLSALWAAAQFIGAQAGKERQCLRHRQAPGSRQHPGACAGRPLTGSCRRP